MLIERQSDALENHSEHLFNSILSTLHQLRESHNSTGIFNTHENKENTQKVDLALCVPFFSTIFFDDL